MIAGAHQRAAFHIFQAFLQTHFPVFGKNIGVYELCYGNVHFSGLQVLANGQYIATVFNQVVHDPELANARLPTTLPFTTTLAERALVEA